MIRIKSQDARHQYDSEGREITTWDSKKCAWIVNSEFENENIDWYGSDSDFPGGFTLAEYIKEYPDWAEKPNIIVIWTWDNKESYFKTFNENPKVNLPYCPSRSWGYLNYTKEEAIDNLGKYCKFNVYADNVKVSYNGETIFDGKLQ